MKHTIFLLWLLLPLPLSAQQFLNLDFEQINSEGKPMQWEILPGENIGNLQHTTTDTATRYSGSRSLRLESSASAQGNENEELIVRTDFPATLVRGKKVTCSVWIKTGQVAEGKPNLWWRADRSTGETDFASLEENITGTTNWKKYSIETRVHEKTNEINFGFTFSGKGTVWLDAVEILIDGSRFTDRNHPREPTQRELQWLRKNSIPLASLKAETGFSDLQAFKKVVGDARIVALGEATHTTSEFFTVKHRLLEYLVTQMGFTVFVIEDQMDECRLLNEYVVHGKGEAKQIMAQIFQVWNRQEMLDMVLWMRRYNQAHAGTPGFKPVQFLGMDMLYANAAPAQLREFFARHEPEMLAQVDSIQKYQQQLYPVRDANTLPAIAAAFTRTARLLQQHITQHQQAVVAVQGQSVYEWFVQCARLLVQNATDLELARSQASALKFYRDSCMAANTRWIAEQNPQEKMVLWAHNLHIHKKAKCMGYFMEKMYRQDYLAVGLTTYEGTYLSFKSKGSFDTAPIDPNFDSYEYYFHRAIPGNFILDIRKASATSLASQWLTRPMNFLTIPLDTYADQFEETELVKSYDVLLFIDQSSPSRKLK